MAKDFNFDTMQPSYKGHFFALGLHFEEAVAEGAAFQSYPFCLSKSAPYSTD